MGKYPKVNELRGWWIHESSEAGKSYWVAKRFGVCMNHSTYDGLISMILNRVY